MFADFFLSKAGFRSRTFTFHITPEFVPPSTGLAKLIDRKLVLSYRSFLFLKENTFLFEKAFLQGIPYMSRPEGVFAKDSYLSKAEPPRRPIPGNDAWLSSFHNDARAKIAAWLMTNPGLVCADGSSLVL